MTTAGQFLPYDIPPLFISTVTLPNMGIPRPSMSFRLPAGLPNVPPLTILRITQFLLALLTLSLAAAVAASYNNKTSSISSPREINFLIFTSLFTLLIILPYTSLSPRYFPRLASAYLMLSAEATSTLFYFAAFVSAAAMINTESHCAAHACDAAIASTIFAAFLFMSFAATTSFALHHLLTSPPVSIPKYKRTHYHSHSRNLSNLAMEKHYAHERLQAKLAHHSCTSKEDVIAYPPPNLKILPKRGCDLEVSPDQRHQDQSSWSPDSYTGSGGLGPGDTARPYSTRVAGRVRQGVGDIKQGASEVGERLRARMPKGVQSTWFGRDSRQRIPDHERGWRHVHEIGGGPRTPRVEMQS